MEKNTHPPPPIYIIQEIFTVNNIPTENVFFRPFRGGGSLSYSLLFLKRRPEDLVHNFHVVWHDRLTIRPSVHYCVLFLRKQSLLYIFFPANRKCPYSQVDIILMGRFRRESTSVKNGFVDVFGSRASAKIPEGWIGGSVNLHKFSDDVPIKIFGHFNAITLQLYGSSRVRLRRHNNHCCALSRSFYPNQFFFLDKNHKISFMIVKLII